MRRVKLNYWGLPENVCCPFSGRVCHCNWSYREKETKEVQIRPWRCVYHHCFAAASKVLLRSCPFEVLTIRRVNDIIYPGLDVYLLDVTFARALFLSFKKCSLWTRMFFFPVDWTDRSSNSWDSHLDFTPYFKVKMAASRPLGFSQTYWSISKFSPKNDLRFTLFFLCFVFPGHSMKSFRDENYIPHTASDFYGEKGLG